MHVIYFSIWEAHSDISNSNKFYEESTQDISKQDRGSVYLLLVSFEASRSGWLLHVFFFIDATLLAITSQHCRMLHFKSICTPCCKLLRVVWSFCAKFETGQTFSYVQTAQQCWKLLRSFARSLSLCWLNCFHFKHTD